MNVQNTLQSISRLWETCIQSPRRRTTSRSHISHELEGRQLLAAVIANAAPTVTTSIEGRVFADANKDGKVNGDEKGLGGRGVQLVDANNKVAATVQTKPDGSFRFENMPAGTYTVREILPPGATSTTPPKPITVKADSKITGILVGEAPPAEPPTVTTSIEGRVFADANKDGKVNGDEKGLGGRGVQLVDANNKIVATVQTKPDGSFRFVNMPAGTYTVREILPPGATSTTPPKPISVKADSKITGILVGEAPPAEPPTVTTSIEGRVFADANKDGKVNGDEKGLGGRGVQLVDANNKVVATVQTKPDGSFRFVNMPAGTYTVREILPPGATSTTPPKPITVKADSKITGILVGEAPPAEPPTVTTSIEGRVFADANKDGKVNGDEKGLGGRGVQLVDANNKVVATVQTKPDGSFRFVNMPAGTYTVREILPPGATSTTPPKPITVKADSKITGILVGEAPPAQPQSQSSSTNSVTLQGSLLNSLLS